MFTPEDEQTFLQLFDGQEIPEDVREMYGRVVRDLHRVSGGGSMGPLACAMIKEMCGYSSLHTGPIQEEGVDWRRIESGTPVSVRRPDGHFSGEIDGRVYRFDSIVGAGTLAIKTPDGAIDEYFASNVSLYLGPAGEEGGDTVSLDDELPEKWEGEPDVKTEPTPDTEPDTEPDDTPPPNAGQPIVPDVMPEVDWKHVTEGTEVWVRDGEDMLEGTFQRPVPGGRVMVKFEGEDERAISVKHVMIPG